MLFFLALLFIFSSISCMENPRNGKQEKKTLLISDDENDYVLDKETYENYWPKLRTIHDNISDTSTRTAYQLLLKLSAGRCVISKDAARLLEQYKFPVETTQYTDDLREVIEAFGKLNTIEIPTKEINFPTSTNTIEFPKTTSTMDWSQFNPNAPVNTNKQSQ